MPAQLLLDRAVDQHTSRVIVANIEDDCRFPVTVLVDVLGRLEGEGNAAEAGGGIQIDSHLLAVRAYYSCDRPRFHPYLAIEFRLLPDVGPIQSGDAAQEITRIAEGVGDVANARSVGDPTIGNATGPAHLGEAVLDLAVSVLGFLDRLEQPRIGHAVEDVSNGLRMVL